LPEIAALFGVHQIANAPLKSISVPICCACWMKLRVARRQFRYASLHW
jgi:hypothetical protein